MSSTKSRGVDGESLMRDTVARASSTSEAQGSRAVPASQSRTVARRQLTAGERCDQNLAEAGALFHDEARSIEVGASMLGGSCRRLDRVRRDALVVAGLGRRA